MANVYNMMGNEQFVLEYYLKALIIKEELGDKLGIAIALNNIGGMYNDLGKTQLAIDYSNRSLKIAKEIGYDTSKLIWVKHDMNDNPFLNEN